MKNQFTFPFYLVITSNLTPPGQYLKPQSSVTYYHGKTAVLHYHWHIICLTLHGFNNGDASIL